MVTEITSASNDKIKFIKSLSAAKNRKKSGKYTVEGLRSVRDALSFAKVDCVVVTKKMMAELKPDFDGNVYIVPEYILEKICETENPQGVLAVVNAAQPKEPIKRDGAYVYTDNVRDPGNLGTIIRTADAAGFDGVILSPDTAEHYNPKVIRASMGSFFRIPVYAGRQLFEFSEHKIYGGILGKNTADYREPDYDGGIIIAVGNEANGISGENRKKCIPIKIPIYGEAESLNAAVAAAIMIYEAANKRNRGKVF